MIKTYNLYFDGEKQFAQDIQKYKGELKKPDQSILVQVFTSKNSISKIKKLKNKIIKHIPNCYLIGSTSDGEFIDNNITLNKTVVSISIFKETKLRIFSRKNSDRDSYRLGRKLVQNLMSKDLKALILFGDGINLNGEDFLKAIDTVMPDIQIAGGMAGTFHQNNEIFVFTNDDIFDNGAVGVALYNENLKIYTDYKFNWQQIGHKMKITSSKKIEYTP